MSISNQDASELIRKLRDAAYSAPFEDVVDLLDIERIISEQTEGGYEELA